MNIFLRYQSKLLSLPRAAKQSLMIGIDLLAFPCAIILAFAIRLDTGLTLPLDSWLIFAAPIITVAVLYFSNFYQMVVRYLGSETVWSIVLGMTVATAVLAALAYMWPAKFVPRSVFIIYWLLGVLYLGGSRFLMRRYLYWVVGSFGSRIAVAIYGAGAAGAQAASALQNDGDFWPAVFVDDDKRLHGTTIQGIKVLGRDGLCKAVEDGTIDTVLLSMPSISRRTRLDIVHFLETLHVTVKSIPALPDIINGRAYIEDVRDVAIEDLLGRDSVPPNEKLLHASVKGKNVLVTGAGGSIGSELCRQLVLLKPERLILLELSEYALYALERELSPLCEEHGVELDAALGSVLNRKLIVSTLRKYQVQTVYHAAAYKHVPIVEHNIQSGVDNNVSGTLVMAEEAERAGVERFILISTDKAVRPTNVMGASKRMAELVLQSFADRGSNTIFSMVRFGNVLGSSGSVVPLFRQQIRAGGPVTVTHPEVTRYFMTIPEAAQLVIQAGSMANGGEVFVLDMGEPVRIFDLAVTMIHLMGLTVRDCDNLDGDIEVQFSGLRAGEKLYEELLIGEQSVGTDHPAIMRAHEELIPWGELSNIIGSMRELLHEGDDLGVRRLLSQCVAGYIVSEAANASLDEQRSQLQSKTQRPEKSSHLH